MRKERRFGIRCPVTVRRLNGSKPTTEVRGVLCEIGLGGARVELQEAVTVGARIVLFVHFQAPDQQVTTIRFEGTVENGRDHPPFEIGVTFRGTGRFLQKQVGEIPSPSVANPPGAR